MPESVVSRDRIRARVSATHRDGQGNLISHSVAIEAPAAPKCLKPKCLFRFFEEVLFCGLLSEYHKRRVEYAEGARHGTILTKYRTGEPAPKASWQAIFDIIVLSIRRSKWLKVKL